jgi:hypothetical protein
MSVIELNIDHGNRIDSANAALPAGKTIDEARAASCVRAENQSPNAAASSAQYFRDAIFELIHGTVPTHSAICVEEQFGAKRLFPVSRHDWHVKDFDPVFNESIEHFYFNLTVGIRVKLA